MKKMSIIILLITATPVLFMIFINYFNTHICQGKFFSELRHIVEIFCPPKDLFHPVLLRDVDLQMEFHEEIKFKYIGKYTVSIVARDEASLKLVNDQIVQVVSKITLERKNQILYTQDYVSNDTFLTKYGQGIIIGQFEIPSNMVNKDLLIKIEVSGKKSLNGISTKLLIQRQSEI